MGREGEQQLALPGPCPCSSCGGVLLVPPVGSGAAWPQQRENMSQVRGCPARQACLSAGKESGQWLVQELQQGNVFCGQVSCGYCLPMGGNSPLSLLCSDSHVAVPLRSCPSYSLQYCYRLSLSYLACGWRGSFNVTQSQPSQHTTFFYRLFFSTQY